MPHTFLFPPQPHDSVMRPHIGRLHPSKIPGLVRPKMWQPALLQKTWTRPELLDTNRTFSAGGPGPSIQLSYQQRGFRAPHMFISCPALKPCSMALLRRASTKGPLPPHAPWLQTEHLATFLLPRHPGGSMGCTDTPYPHPSPGSHDMFSHWTLCTSLASWSCS